MNEFYDIAPENIPPKNEYQLENRGKQKVIYSGVKRNRDPWGPRTKQVERVYGEVTKDDYDSAFAFKVTSIRPPYELDKLINYHLDYYVGKGGDRDKFIKHIQYVVFPYMEEHYQQQKPHLELTKQWIEEAKKIKSLMLEYNDLNDTEKNALNTMIASTNEDLLFSPSDIWLYKSEFDKIITDNNEYHTKRLISFLLSNSFIRPRAYDGSYFIEPEGRKMFKYGSVDKYYEKQTKQSIQSNPNIVGHGNVVNIAGGNVTQSGITININSQEYDKLKEWGVEKSKIDELKVLVEKNKSDKPTLMKNCMKWLGEVTKQVAAKGIIEHLPQINDFITNLISQ